jgi:hypothetical protein
LQPASLSVVCYPKPGKQKSQRLLSAFARGCGGRLAEGAPERLAPGAAAFYDVRGLEHLWRQACDEGRRWYYLDNAYFDIARDRLYRVGVDAMQDRGLGLPDWKRWAALGLPVAPWQRRGRHIVVCRQSAEFLALVGAPWWLGHTLAALEAATDRPIVVREKGEARALAEDLKGAWALVTHSSAAAVEAVLAGVPVFCTGFCAARTMGLSELAMIERPRRPDGREIWAATLAGLQWSAEELADGTAWRMLQCVKS